MIKGILLDVDGTLVLSNEAHAHSWVDAFAEYGYSVPFDKTLRLVGMGGDKLITELQPELNDESGDGKKIKDLRTEIFLGEYASDLQPAPGARQLVETLHAAGLKTVAASSSKQQELEVLLKAANVGDLLTEATSTDDADNSKPDPDIIQAALHKIGLAADEVILIGDTPYDIESAGKAGIKCIAVRCGGWDDEGLKGAIAVFDDPQELLSSLPALLQR